MFYIVYPFFIVFIGIRDLASQLKICPESVRALAELLRETDLSEIEYQVDSLRIKVVRSVQSSVVPVSSTQFESANIQDVENHTTQVVDHTNDPNAIKAKMVGTVYLAPGPGSAHFVNVGDTVHEGQTLFIIEAMKVMNMIKAQKSGVVKEILVSDAQPVEYDEPIMIIS